METGTGRRRLLKCQTHQWGAFERGEDGAALVERMDRLDRRIVRRLIMGAVFAVGVPVACALLWRPPAPVAAQATPAASPVATAQPAPGDNANGPLEVTVGLYVLEIHELDQQASTYKADFYLWMRWRGAFDPTPTEELINNTNRWTLTMTPIYTKAIDLSGGERLQQFHVQGSFFHALDLRDYPLDKHELTVEFEDSTYPSDQLIYVPDTAQSHWVRAERESAVRAQRLDRLAAAGQFGFFVVGTVILLVPVL